MMEINRGFETMIPAKEEVKKPFFNYSISFKIFKRKYSFTIDITGDENVGDSSSTSSLPGNNSRIRDWLAQ